MLSPIKTGVPQGSCASLILAAFFTTPLCRAIEEGMRKRLESLPELSPIIQAGNTNIAPLTLYVDNVWLMLRGLKTDQVKNELIHFTRSTRGRHSGPGPSATIPTNIPNETKTITPAKVICYLGIWLDSQLNFNEHIRRMTSKAIGAAHALRLLGNLLKGIHQTHTRQLYNGAILPVATYGLPTFWKSKKGKVLSSLTSMQNKCLCMTTGAF